MQPQPEWTTETRCAQRGETGEWFSAVVSGMGVGEVPKPKFQTPNFKERRRPAVDGPAGPNQPLGQGPNQDGSAGGVAHGTIEIWALEFLWSLGLGAWNFPARLSVPPRTAKSLENLLRPRRIFGIARRRGQDFNAMWLTHQTVRRTAMECGEFSPLSAGDLSPSERLQVRCRAACPLARALWDAWRKVATACGRRRVACGKR